MEETLNYFHNEPNFNGHEDYEKLTPQEQKRIKDVLKKQSNYYAHLVGEGTIVTRLHFTFVHWPKELTAENFSEDNVLMLGLSLDDISILVLKKIISKEKAIQMVKSTSIMAEKLFDYTVSNYDSLV